MLLLTRCVCFSMPVIDHQLFRLPTITCTKQQRYASHNYRIISGGRAIRQSEYLRRKAELRKQSLKVRLQNSTKDIVDNFKQLIKERQDKFSEQSWPTIVNPGQRSILFDFKDASVRNSWICACDSTNNEGFSTAVKEESSTGVLRFHGNIDVDKLPNDGVTVNTGWAAIVSPLKTRSFYRPDFYNWKGYTHLTMLIRGDGRTYKINLRSPLTSGMWKDGQFQMFSYGVFTRGGPYWQHVSIPFSKFVPTENGYHETRWHHPVTLDHIRSIGLTLNDGYNGPFDLEIAHIGLKNDPKYHEEHAYELYYYPKHKWAL